MGKTLKKLICFILVLSVVFVSMPLVFAEDSDADVIDADTIEEYADAISDMVDYQQENITGEPTDEAQDDEFYSCRIIVKSYYVKQLDLERFDPVSIVYNENDDGAVIQFDTREQTKICLDALNDDPRVEYAETDRLIKIPEHSDGEIVFPKENLRNSILSWGVSYSKADSFVDSLVAQGNNNAVIVSVVDTGVYAAHEYLQGRILSGGYDFAYGDNNPYDGDGHGTHVSGTIVDVTGDLNVKILPVKVLDDTGSGYTSWITSGIDYAVQHGANVINMSLGGGHENSNAMEESVRNAISNGVTVCVAAGNESTDTSYSCPAHVSEAICVSAIDQYSNKASFSNYGSHVDIAAPGVGIYSCYTGGGYESLNGTSMATPHVAGFAAIVKAMYPDYTPAQVEQTLKNACDDLGSSGWDQYYGYGKVNFDKMVEPHEHEFVTSTIAPTCTEQGYDKKECTVCHVVQTSNIVPALGHAWNEPEIIRPVGCTVNGLTRTTCSRCGYHVDEITYQTGHNYQVTVVERSCNTAGYKFHKCLNCGESYMTEYVAAFDHTPGDWEIQTPPTCSWEGTEVRICSVCGEVAESRTVPKAGHSFEETVVEPTCTLAGYKKMTCTVCSYSQKEDETPKLGHDYQVTTVIRPSTCTMQGLAYTKCTRCTSKSTTKLPLGDHNPSDWKVVTPATVDAEGLRIKECTVCGNVLESEVIEKIEYMLEATDNSSAVIDDENGFIYGLEEGIAGIDSFVEAVGCEVECVPTANGFGTGTTVNLVDNGKVIKSYKLVIFGDVDGDGYCDGCDYVLMSLYINWQYAFDDDCYLYAADITNDGSVDAFDLSLSSLSGVQLYSTQQVRQIKSLAN